MKDLVEEAAELQTLLESKGWAFCFIGGLAIQRWSEPRLTNWRWIGTIFGNI